MQSPLLLKIESNRFPALCTKLKKAVPRFYHSVKKLSIPDKISLREQNRHEKTGKDHYPQIKSGKTLLNLIRFRLKNLLAREILEN